ncbi:unnamed protein product [Didymodactylos carnosus]|uniref:SCP domain-containing protein n=1 Tax=Didymodactylos carnosus TaxID=1234261 RepID=A0A813ZH97_9BILA|nr:unnamed protein product [Didymodactylos carnosus]CAF0898685.1 unnamed protein product [Didymodactylos carnosus]CAF3673358.1 unnamed protein product [Didymodactylos carnosus]CAF3681507.1 unnamed protein product [Didymodactylos carnosus]
MLLQDSVLSIVRVSSFLKTNKGCHSRFEERPPIQQKHITMIYSILSLLLALNAISTNGQTLFQSQALTQHNLYRQKQCAPPLAFNQTIADISQAWAKSMSQTNTLQHSTNKLNGHSLGENIGYMCSSTPSVINGSQPTAQWYNEIAQYNFSNPGYSSATGHFTAVVWVATKVFGIGISQSSTNKCYYYVANYYPAGNDISSVTNFIQNVKKPPC